MSYTPKLQGILSLLENKNLPRMPRVETGFVQMFVDHDGPYLNHIRSAYVIADQLYSHLEADLEKLEQSHASPEQWSELSRRHHDIRQKVADLIAKVEKNNEGNLHNKKRYSIEREKWNDVLKGIEQPLTLALSQREKAHDTPSLHKR